MTLNRSQLNKGAVNSPYKSPRASISARRRSAIRKINQEVKFGSASKANLKVVVRIRPENKREIETGQKSVVDIVDDHMLVFDPKTTDDDFFFHGAKQGHRDLNKKQQKQQKFYFENVFGPESTNQQVFENTTKNLIDTILNGYNCSVFAYGATGAGKTYTMLGSPNNHGIAFLTVMELYKQIKELSDVNCEIGVSYLEVYNELVMDLLKPGTPLNLHEIGQQVKISGLSLHKPKDEKELLEILEKGNKNRSQHPTDINAESSRSHAVFQVFVRQQSIKPGLSNVSIAKLSMIDLAGSERGTATGFKGARFREGASINKSLLALGNCINALADGKSHIPYRDSKLTRLLKDSIGGNCRSVMIAAASRANGSFEDTFNTLKYANRAKTIKTTLKKNVMSVNNHVSQYVKIVEMLREENLSLTNKLKYYEENEKEPISEPGSTDLSSDERTMYEETIQDLRKQLEEKYVSNTKRNEQELELLSSLNAINMQMKALQRELLQLEADERLLTLRQFSHQNNLVSMNMYIFASRKMAKGISKSENIIQSCTTRLDNIRKRKDFLRARLTSYKLTAQEATQNLMNHSHANEYSENVKKTLDFYNLEMISRDNHQSVEYLQTLLKALFAERFGTNKLAILLLYAAKSFYLKLVSSDVNDEKCKELFDHIVTFLDSSQIEWADQKHTEDSIHEEVINQHIPSPITSLNIEYLTSLPHLQDFSLSPAVYEILPGERRSIMKTTSSYVTLPALSNAASHVTPMKEKSDVVKQSALSFIDKSEIELSPEPEIITEFHVPVVKKISWTQGDIIICDTPSPVLDETFNLATSPILAEVTNEVDFKANSECIETELETSYVPSTAPRISKDALNSTFSITSSLSHPATGESNKTFTKDTVTKNLLPNTKRLTSILKSSISTPFKMPKTPGMLTKSSNFSKPVVNSAKKIDSKSMKKSFSVGTLSGVNALRTNSLTKPSGSGLRRMTSFRTNKENAAPLKLSASSSRLLSSQVANKRSDNKPAEHLASKNLKKPVSQDTQHNNE